MFGGPYPFCSGTGRLRIDLFGTITDNTGAVVRTRKLPVTDIAKGTAVQPRSDASGDYRVGSTCIPTAIAVDVEAPGFSKRRQTM